MNKVKILFAIFGIPAVVYHELSHAIMAYIVGAKFTGIKVICESYKLETFSLSASVYSRSKNGFQKILISAAPLLSWIAGYIIFLHYFFPVALYFACYTQMFMPSLNDWHNIKCHVKKNGIAHSSTDEAIISEMNNIRSMCEKQNQTTQTK